MNQASSAANGASAALRLTYLSLAGDCTVRTVKLPVLTHHVEVAAPAGWWCPSRPLLNMRRISVQRSMQHMQRFARVAVFSAQIRNL
ncbi:hypothetical protein [Roseovarius sp. ZX-A-9]|uniref:hypothetical protein n=1 Tax=Roseovarius sp. ZX-A-9 TaxID=3014783 RepID=UPI00233118E1|nr:hypothetical protein [Roseovarius sp. ZX-A-9]